MRGAVASGCDGSPLLPLRLLWSPGAEEAFAQLLLANDGAENWSWTNLGVPQQNPRAPYTRQHARAPSYD